MNVKEWIGRNRVIFDGGTGTLLQKSGLPVGELPERWNITHPELIEDIHTAYFDAGSHIVCTNTFGANGLKFSCEELAAIIRAAVENAKRARTRSVGKQPKFIALDIGPLGKLFKPYGDLAFEEGVRLFAEVVTLGAKEGVDLIYIETVGDSYEAKAAALAAKENCVLPVIVSCAYGEDGKLMTGATPAATVALLEGLGVDGIGVNCSLGPKQMRPVVEELLKHASVPVLVKPNAGLPTVEGGYDIGEEEFAVCASEFAQMGARMLGGCCGTTPDYIRKVAAAVENIPLQRIENKQKTVVSSYTHAVEFNLPLLIGERINPTGKKRFQQALKERDLAYILNEGVTQQEKGVHILDVNVGAPDIDEAEALPYYIQELQAVSNLPLQIDTSNGEALARAMRLYNGKPLVNSVNGKKESMATVFPLVKKYGGVVIALTLDEKGIPNSVEGRMEIARRIIAEGVKYGIEKKDIVVDPLAMAISADKNAAKITLQTVAALTAEGIKTSLGVSNVSFGLPVREAINAAFFLAALCSGLSAAILNPNSTDMLKTYYAHLAVQGLDENFVSYIDFASKLVPTATTLQTELFSEKSPLKRAIVKGLKEEAVSATKALLEGKQPLTVIEEELIPALDTVGRAYEEKRAFLPQLLVSAEAAKGAFEQIKDYLIRKGQSQKKRAKVVLATVRGDIHDIGKNIVASLLENYGFEVIDLGRDVPPAAILEATQRENAPVVGLSALMTTTLPSMEETVKLLQQKAPWVKIVVGGAVVTQEYADRLGVYYAKDAMASVRYAEKQ